jgi:hypothetical protein
MCKFCQISHFVFESYQNMLTILGFSFLYHKLQLWYIVMYITPHLHVVNSYERYSPTLFECNTLILHLNWFSLYVWSFWSFQKPLILIRKKTHVHMLKSFAIINNVIILWTIHKDKVCNNYRMAWNVHVSFCLGNFFLVFLP